MARTKTKFCQLEGKGDLAVYYRILCEELGTHAGQEEATLNNYTYQLPWRDGLSPWLSCFEGSAGRALEKPMQFQ